MLTLYGFLFNSSNIDYQLVHLKAKNSLTFKNRASYI